MKIYLASSWKNALHRAVAATLRAAGHTVYDHATAQHDYEGDYAAMYAADACVMILPGCRLSHLQAGWFVGAGRPVYLFMESGPEEGAVRSGMYRLCQRICIGEIELLDAVGILNRDTPAKPEIYTWENEGGRICLN